MTEPEVEFFKSIAGDRSPPTGRVRELWIVTGRRSGKDSVTSLIAAHAASLFDQQRMLRGGERALVACLACDRAQAKIVHGYIGAYFRNVPLLNPLLVRETNELFELNNAVDIAVSTNSFRAVRGRPILLAILDECAFWRDETSAKPDQELYDAITPALASLAPQSMIIGISSPYRK